MRSIGSDSSRTPVAHSASAAGGCRPECAPLGARQLLLLRGDACPLAQGLPLTCPANSADSCSATWQAAVQSIQASCESAQHSQQGGRHVPRRARSQVCSHITGTHPGHPFPSWVLLWSFGLLTASAQVLRAFDIVSCTCVCSIRMQLLVCLSVQERSGPEGNCAHTSPLCSR